MLEGDGSLLLTGLATYGTQHLGFFTVRRLGALPSRPIDVFSFSRHCRRLLHDARPLLLDEGG